MCNTIRQKFASGHVGILAARTGVLFLSLLTLAMASGCDRAEAASTASTNDDKSRILQVMRADHALGEEMKASMPKDPSPSTIAYGIGVYCQRLEAIDMSQCPADFRVAYTQHMRAWRELQATVAKLPDSILECVFQGFLNGLGGETDGGAGRLRGDLRNASNRVESSWAEVERVGAHYGAAL